MSYDITYWKQRIASRTDFTASLVHLTRTAVIDGKEWDITSILIKIITERKLIGSSSKSGFICGDKKAVCFQETPLYSLTENVYLEQEYRKKFKQAKVRYLGAGVIFSKPYVYRMGGRPVICDNTREAKKYLPRDQWWRIVNFDLSNDEAIIDWSHEREWRCPGDFVFDLNEVTIVLPNNLVYKEFIRRCREIIDLDILTEIKGIVNLNAVFF